MIMPGHAPGMMLLGRLPRDPVVVFGIDVLDRQNHESGRRIRVEFFNCLSHRFGHGSAGFYDHDDLLGPLDFPFPPIMRNHARQDIDASGEPALDD